MILNVNKVLNQYKLIILLLNSNFSYPNLLKGVYEMGYNAPSKIQETALPLLLANP